MDIRTWIVLFATLVLLTGCGRAGEPEQEAGEPVRLAVVLPSATTDLAFSQSMWKALEAVRTEMGGESAVDLEYAENMTEPADAEAALRDYADRGFDIVIAHGSQYGSLIRQVAPEFPETTFAWGTDNDTFDLANVHAYTAAAQEGGYVNGVMAAKLTTSKVIGVTGPVEVGDAKAYVDGFVQGVASVDPDITVRTTWTQSFSDEALMTEAANAHITAGADVLTGSSQAVAGSIGAAEKGGVLWFGTQSDQSSLAPEIVVASQQYDWTGILRQIIEDRRDGRLGGETFILQLENDGLEMVFNPAYELSDDVEQAARAAIDGITSGSITVEP